MNNTLDFALKYQRRGWQPLPIPYRSKKPNFPNWQKFETTEAGLPNHFNGKPQNIGILLGAKSKGLTDIDLDSPESNIIADYFLPQTEAEFGRSSSPRSHRLYVCAAEICEKFNNPFVRTSPNKEEKDKACIVEIRGKDGFQTVFPGSTHETSGEAIEWHNDGELLEIDAETLRRSVARLASACLIATFWRSGIRNDLNLALSGALLRNGFDVSETKNFIRAICAAADDEETASRLDAVGATAQKLKDGENVYGFPKFAELTDTKLVEVVCKWLEIDSRKEPPYQAPTRDTGGTNENTWLTKPKPLDSTLKPIETIEDSCLPKVLVDWLRPASKVIGCPFDFLVLSAIVTTGNLIGARLRVKPLENSNWSVVPNIYAGLVGFPSTKKTPALDEVRKPILELQAEARKEYESKKADYDIEIMLYEKKKAGILKKSVDLDELKSEINALGKPVEPKQRRFETNDITASKLIQFLSDNPNGMMLFRDELAGWLRSLENDYDKSARALFLELWKGAIAYEMARVDGREIYLSSGTFSIIGGIQPSKLQKYVSEAYSFDNSDGFLQRFMFAYPDLTKRTGKPSRSEFEQMERGFSFANQTLREIAKYNFNGRVKDSNGGLFKVVKFTKEAQQLIENWKDEIEDEAERIQKDDEPFSSYLYKLPKTCFAIALIFHTLENINSKEFPDEISEATALKAIAYTKVLVSHARRVFALGENQIFTLANILLGKIKKGGLTQGFTKREITRKQWSGLNNAETVIDVLNLLVDYGYLLEVKTQGEGRPTSKYFFHPSLESEVTENEEKQLED